MKLFPHLLCVVLLACSLSWVKGQVADDDIDNPPSPPVGATVITSDELRMDQVVHTAVFTGNVVVVGNNFHMTCEEMTVYFTKDSKIDNILAKGNVVIVQPGRVTHCGQAQYMHDTDEFILTQEPDILDNKNEISAPKIIINRTKQSLRTFGATRTVITQGIGSSTSTTTPAANSQH